MLISVIFCSSMALIIIIIIIVVVVVDDDFITLFIIYLLGNLHLSQIVGGIRVSQEKQIHLIP